MARVSRMLAVGACVIVAVAAATPAVAKTSLGQAESHLRDNIAVCGKEEYKQDLSTALDLSLKGATTAAQLRRTFRHVVRTQVHPRPFEPGCVRQMRKERRKHKG